MPGSARPLRYPHRGSQRGFPLRGSCHRRRQPTMTDEVSAGTFFANRLKTAATTSSASLRSAPVSLRLGHAAALTCHRHVIHSRGDASLPSRGRLFGLSLRSPASKPPCVKEGGCHQAAGGIVPETNGVQPLSHGFAVPAPLTQGSLELQHFQNSIPHRQAQIAPARGRPHP